MKRINILLIISFCSTILADNSCRFQHPVYGLINLESIGLRNGQPRFRDVSSSMGSSYTYSFNPCYPFTENNCQNAAVCQTSADRQYSFTLGTQNVATWSLNSNIEPVLTYTYGSKKASITLICSADAEDQLEILGEYAVNQYAMRLRSRCACWDGCKNPQSSTTTASSTSPSTTAPMIYYNACTYFDSRYGMVDLSSVGSTTGRAAFKDVKSIYSSNFVWSYNPCYKFSEYSCHDVAGCQIEKSRGISYTIGLQDFVSWNNMNNSKSLAPTIVYLSPQSNRRLSVKLICDRSISSHRLHVLGETAIGEYAMELTSPCACWDGCTKSSTFRWKFWMTVAAGLAVVFILFLLMITCLLCSKPRQRYPIVLIDEHTPIIKGAVSNRK